MTAEAPPTPTLTPTLTPTPRPKSRRRRFAIGFGIVVAVIVAYALSLLGVHLLAETSGPLAAPDLGTTDDTVILVRLEELKTVQNRLMVNVLVIPEDSMFDKRLKVLTTDTAVRIYPENDLGDLQYPAGKSPAQVATTIDARGDPGNWPFDSYTTATISADVLVGSGDQRKYRPARVEVTGSLEGWDISAARVGEATQTSDRPDDVVITVRRAKGPLVFDLGICLALISLPTVALWVAIPMALGRRKFVPPFATWYAAMLFAIVPLRNILPGAPPAGSWVDQALVLWVLIALIAAMVLFIFAWHRHTD